MPMAQPIVILGGFLSFPKVYCGMRDLLAQIAEQPVGIVAVRTLDWLRGSRQIVLHGVSHFTGFGGPWYGAEKVIPRWWNACMGEDKVGGEVIII